MLTVDHPSSVVSGFCMFLCSSTVNMNDQQHQGLQPRSTRGPGKPPPPPPAWPQRVDHALDHPLRPKGSKKAKAVDTKAQVARWRVPWQVPVAGPMGRWWVPWGCFSEPGSRVSGRRRTRWGDRTFQNLMDETKHEERPWNKHTCKQEATSNKGHRWEGRKDATV